jgi:hypothetical protein
VINIVFIKIIQKVAKLTVVLYLIIKENINVRVMNIDAVYPAVRKIKVKDVLMEAYAI